MLVALATKDLLAKLELVSSPVSENVIDQLTSPKAPADRGKTCSCPY